MAFPIKMHHLTCNASSTNYWLSTEIFPAKISGAEKSNGNIALNKIQTGNYCNDLTSVSFQLEEAIKVFKLRCWDEDTTLSDSIGWC